MNRRTAFPRGRRCLGGGSYLRERKYVASFLARRVVSFLASGSRRQIISRGVGRDSERDASYRSTVFVGVLALQTKEVFTRFEAGGFGVDGHRFGVGADFCTALWHGTVEPKRTSSVVPCFSKPACQTDQLGLRPIRHSEDLIAADNFSFGVLQRFFSSSSSGVVKASGAQRSAPTGHIGGDRKAPAGRLTGVKERK
jgi:hypothetical protein